MYKFAKLVAALLFMCYFILTGTALAAEDVDWWKQVTAPYKGLTIHGISESTPASKIAIKQELAPLFEQLTGIKVQFEVTSWDAMYTKSLSDMSRGTGIYDFVYVEQDTAFDYIQQNWIVDLTKYIADNPKLTDPNLDLNDFISYIDYFKDTAGNLYAVPFEAYPKTIVYRKDLFEDPTIQAAFKAEFGWNLRPAMNWKEYEQIAKFFTEWGKKEGVELYGHVAEAKTHPCLAWEQTLSVWPLFGIYNWGINPETLGGSVAKGGMVNSEKTKAVVKQWIDRLQFAPPGVRTYTWDEVAASIASGKVVQGLLYTENLGWICQDRTKSNVIGKLGVALPPTAPGVMEEAVRGTGYLGYYDGGAMGIPRSSTKKEAAWLFIQWISRKEFAPVFAIKATGAVRKSTFDLLEVKEADKKLGGVFEFSQKYGHMFAGCPKFPGVLSLIDKYLVWLSKASSGETPVDEALDALAKEVDQHFVDLR